MTRRFSYWCLAIFVLTGLFVGLLQIRAYLAGENQESEPDRQLSQTEPADVLQELPEEQREIVKALMDGSEPFPDGRLQTAEPAPGAEQEELAQHADATAVLPTALEIHYLDRSEETMRAYEMHAPARRPEFADPESDYNRTQRQKLIELSQSRPPPVR